MACLCKREKFLQMYNLSTGNILESFLRFFSRRENSSASSQRSTAISFPANEPRPQTRRSSGRVPELPVPAAAAAAKHIGPAADAGGETLPAHQPPPTAQPVVMVPQHALTRATST